MIFLDLDALTAQFIDRSPRDRPVTVSAAQLVVTIATLCTGAGSHRRYRIEHPQPLCPKTI
ncbi:hypothetical protein [Mycobacterium lepromatosis]|uniref:hypothetical protein n=1 Tax=Mycobacterium lepromatosis TaxID=480418 RepID=UPI0005F7AE74|nr:hypothetical protein [Mycobacterium lepromatosis]